MLPSDWKLKQLGENAHIKARIGWRGLSADEYTTEGPLLIAGTHIRDSHIHWVSCDHISDFRYEESPEIQLQEDDVILSKDGTLGRIGIVEHLPGRATINGTMMLVRPDTEVFWPKFIYYYLQGRNFRRFIKERVSGSSVPHIFQRDMVRLLVPAPPIREQCKIAAILSLVDDAIEKTQAVIDQVQVVKRGLMQELLTRGLPGQHTRFKQTEIGEIPEKWEVCSLAQLCDRMFVGIAQAATHAYAERGVPIIRTTNVRANRLDLENMVCITDEFAREMKRKALCGGDVLTARTGYPGTSVVVPRFLDGAQCLHFLYLALDHDSDPDTCATR